MNTTITPNPGETDPPPTMGPAVGDPTATPAGVQAFLASLSPEFHLELREGGPHRTKAGNPDHPRNDMRAVRKLVVLGYQRPQILEAAWLEGHAFSSRARELELHRLGRGTAYLQAKIDEVSATPDRNGSGEIRKTVEAVQAYVASLPEARFPGHGKAVLLEVLKHFHRCGRMVCALPVRTLADAIEPDKSCVAGWLKQLRPEWLQLHQVSRNGLASEFRLVVPDVTELDTCRVNQEVSESVTTSPSHPVWSRRGLGPLGHAVWDQLDEVEPKGPKDLTDFGRVQLQAKLKQLVEHGLAERADRGLYLKRIDVDLDELADAFGITKRKVRQRTRNALDREGFAGAQFDRRCSRADRVVWEPTTTWACRHRSSGVQVPYEAIGRTHVIDGELLVRVPDGEPVDDIVEEARLNAWRFTEADPTNTTTTGVSHLERLPAPS